MALFLVTVDDLYLAQTTPFFTFYIPFHIFVVGGVKDFKFDWQVDHNKC